LCAVERINLVEDLLNCCHETFVSNIAVKFSCQQAG
jgi:hypothetical protein